MKPIVVINFKTYNQGESVVKLARSIENSCDWAIVGVQASDIKEVVKATKLRVYAEHVDPFKPGRHTGYIIPEAVKADGAKGVFLNHSEHRLEYSNLRKSVKRCREVRLKIAVFAKDFKEAKKVEKLKPDYIIFEPPELVAGKVSVSRARAELIRKISSGLKSPFLVGAGIKTREDVQTAMKLGARGFALSSAITKSRNPEKKLRELVG